MKLSNLEHTINEQDILFKYEGTISQDFINNTSETIEDILEKHGNIDKSSNLFRNIFSIIVEQLQNIMNHSENISKQYQHIFSSDGIFILGFNKVKNKYFITTVNQVRIDDIKTITHKIDSVNSMDTTELRKKIRELLKNGKGLHARGAGVGFLVIGKMSSENLTYDFQNKKNQSLFILNTFV
jgi:phage-related tail protein